MAVSTDRTPARGHGDGHGSHGGHGGHGASHGEHGIYVAGHSGHDGGVRELWQACGLAYVQAGGTQQITRAGERDKENSTTSYWTFTCDLSSFEWFFLIKCPLRNYFQNGLPLLIQTLQRFPPVL